MLELVLDECMFLEGEHNDTDQEHGRQDEKSQLGKDADAEAVEGKSQTHSSYKKEMVIPYKDLTPEKEVNDRPKRQEWSKGDTDTIPFSRHHEGTTADHDP